MLRDIQTPADPARRNVLTTGGLGLLTVAAVGVLANSTAMARAGDASASDVDILNIALGLEHEAIAAYQTVLLLDPADPAEVHFRLAKLFNATDAKSAKQHILMALEEAPRFREAHELLLKLAPVETPAPATSSPKKP